MLLNTTLSVKARGLSLIVNRNSVLKANNSKNKKGGNMHNTRWQLLVGIVIILALLVLGGCSSAPSTSSAPAPTTTAPKATTAAPTSAAPTTTTAPPTAAAPTTTSATAITLKFATFQASTEYWTPVITQWAKDFEANTGGRYKVELNYGGGMGASADYYSMLTNGLFDITAWQPTSKPGVFPISELITLPIEAASISVPSMGFEQMYLNGYLDKEFAQAKILFVWAGAGNLMIQNKKSAATIADMKGIKIGTAGGYAVDVITAAGAVPVSMPLPDRYINIQKGVIDGTMGTWAALYTNKFYEILKYATEPGVCSSPFTVVMNKATYDKMPKDVQAIVDTMAKDTKYTVAIGKLGDANIDLGKKAFADAGGKIVQWDPADYAKMGTALAPLWTKALTTTEGKGYPANKAVADLYKALQASGSKNPYLGYTPGN
jgi:TRAP-type transport system periplasmic protein